MKKLTTLIMLTALVSLAVPVNAQQHESSAQRTPAVKKTNAAKVKKTPQVNPTHRAVTTTQLRQLTQKLEDLGAGGELTISTTSKSCKLKQTQERTQMNNTLDLLESSAFSARPGEVIIGCSTDDCARYSSELGSNKAGKYTYKTKAGKAGEAMRTFEELATACYRFAGKPVPNFKEGRG